MLLTKYGIDHTRLPLSLPTGNRSHLWTAVGKVWHETMFMPYLMMVDELGSGGTAGLLNPSADFLCHYSGSQGHY